MARQGKIARLPHTLREQVNLRLLNNEPGSVVLGWLNAQPEAEKIWEAHFEGLAASAQNLSEWRLGGYRDWLAKRDQADHLKSLSSHAAHLAKAAGNDLSAGAQAILAGHILDTLEIAIHADGGDGETPDDPAGRIQKLASSIATLRGADHNAAKLKLDKRKVDQRERELGLAREKFEAQTVSKFLEWARSTEAAAILDSGKPAHVQMDALRDLFFGPATLAAKGGAA